MKRRQTDGDYESDWQLIPDKYIIKWGKISFGIDDIKANHYMYSNFDFTVDNTTGYFSDENDDKSFFYGYISRYRTMVKVTGGYIDTDDTEYPTVPTLFVGLIADRMPYKEDATMNFSCNHILLVSSFRKWGKYIISMRANIANSTSAITL